MILFDNSEHFADKTCDNNEENIIKHDLIIERKGEIVSFEKESLNSDGQQLHQYQQNLHSPYLTKYK